MFPVLLVLTYGYGVVLATNDLRKTGDVYLVVQKGSNAAPRSRVMLRGFDKGILVRDYMDERIEFVRWEEITLISTFAKRESEPSLSCKWFAIACFGDLPRPPTP
jgi:hypothetical protein